MRNERPELFVGIPEKGDKKPITINLNVPLTNALPVAVSEVKMLFFFISFIYLFIFLH